MRRFSNTTSSSHSSSNSASSSYTGAASASAATSEATTGSPNPTPTAASTTTTTTSTRITASSIAPIGARPSAQSPLDGQGHRRNKSLAEATLSFTNEKDDNSALSPRSTSLSGNEERAAATASSGAAGAAGSASSTASSPHHPGSSQRDSSQPSSNSNTGPPPSPMSSGGASNYSYDAGVPPPSPGWGSSTVSAGTSGTFGFGSGKAAVRPSVSGRVVNEHWEKLASILKQLFQRNVVSESVELRNDLVRLSAKTESESFVYQKCKEIMTKGMIILREQFKDVPESKAFVDKFSHTWTLFYTQILPELQATFQPVLSDTLFEMSVRKLSLLAWRDHVVLNSLVKQKLEDAIASRVTMSSSMLQMLLMVQSVQDNSQNENVIFGLLSSMSVPFLFPDGSDPSNMSRLANRSISESSLKTLADKAQPSQQELQLPAKSPFARHTISRSSRKSYASDRDLDLKALSKEL